MKRIVIVLSIALILLQTSIAGVIGVRPQGLAGSVDGMPRAQSRHNPSVVRRSRPQQPVQTRADNRISFEKFPVGKPVPVDISIDDSSFASMSDRDEQDQIRDWLLLTTLSGVGLSAAQINKITYDLPTIRYSYMQTVGRFEYGETRSANIGKGNVIALVPVSGADQTKKNLGHVADKERMYTGAIPATVNVFQYSVDRLNGKATLSRLESMKGSDLFTPEYGYFEGKITGLNDLSALMGKINDVTVVRIDGNALTVGGRQLSNYRGVRIEDTAALWKSDNSIRIAAAATDTAINTLKNNFFERWQPLMDWLDSGGVPDAQVARQVRQLKSEKTQVEQQIRNIQRSNPQASVQSSGFSLDPTCDYEGLKRFWIAEAKPALIDAFKSSHSAYLQRIAEVENDLSRKNEGSLIGLIEDVRGARNWEQVFLGKSLYESIQKYQFQKARYDGTLQGTEVGMTLFYTDLLAKLWLLDFMDSTPGSEVKDFRSGPEIRVSPVFSSELNPATGVPVTRLWFGPQEQGFQAAGNTLLFARNATRVYSASSNSRDPGHESPPNAPSARFLGWWDSHYEQIAEYEPEYQRLNEIMKWSLLLGWLDRKDKNDVLSFLASIPSEKNLWFPDWANSRPDLRFKDWKEIKFSHRDGQKTSTESLPLLVSEQFNLFGERNNPKILKGGVSLGGKPVFENRGKFPAELRFEEETIRPNQKQDTNRIPGLFKTTDDVTHDLRAVDGLQSIVKSIAKAGAKFRDKFGELAGMKSIERSVARTAGQVKFDTTAGKLGVGSLDISETSQGFGVGWRGRDLAEANSLAQKISVTGKPEMVLATSPNVESYVGINGSDKFIVKLNGSKKLLKLNVGKDSVSSQSRIIDFRGNETSVGLTWIENPTFVSELSGAEYFRFQPLGAKRTAVTVDAGSAIRPPPGLRLLIIGEGPSRINALFDPREGAVYIRTQQVLNAARSDYGKISKLISPSDITAISEIAKTDGNITYVRSMDAATEAEQLRSIDSLLANRKYSNAIELIERAKQASPNNAGLDIRKAVALIQIGESEEASVLYSRLARGIDKAALLDEFNVRVSQSGGNPENGLKFVSDASDVGLDVVQHLNTPLKGEKVTAQEIDLTKATIYVQDDPSRSIQIPGRPDRRVVTQLIHGDLGEVELIKIPRDSIKDANPTMIYEPTVGGAGSGIGGSGGGRVGGNSYRLVSGGDPTRSTTRRGIRTTRGWMPVYVCPDDRDDNNNNCDNDRNNIYIVRPKPHKKAA